MTDKCYRDDANSDEREIIKGFFAGKSVGYCHCAKHRGYLNAKLIKSHKCVKKKCRWLEKYIHEYWDRKGRAYGRNTED